MLAYDFVYIMANTRDNAIREEDGNGDKEILPQVQDNISPQG